MDYSTKPSTINWSYTAARERYDSMTYNKCGKSGLKLPAISLGFWQNFAWQDSFTNARKITLKAFDLGITHFDLGNNYGRPPGSAEECLGTILKKDLNNHRDELIISTKAGYDMWPGPYGEWGSKKYLYASLNQSLKRLGVEYVDIFYSHRFDPDTDLEETMHTLEQIVREGKALYVGVSSYSMEHTKKSIEILSKNNIPFIIHQPPYSILNRYAEHNLFNFLQESGLGCAVFSPLAQGLLTDQYLNKDLIEKKARAKQLGSSIPNHHLSQKMINKLNSLNDIAQERGQKLSQMALSWVLRNKVVTSAIIGASKPEQLTENICALNAAPFCNEELEKIDNITKGIDVNLKPWENSIKATNQSKIVGTI